jgi:hypothetical protein
MDSQGLAQRVVERGPVVPKLLPRRLLGLGLVEVGQRRAAGLPLLLQAHHGGILDEVSASCVGRRGITQPSSCITSTPAAGSGAGASQFSHWPHPGGKASSSGISTMAA